MKGARFGQRMQNFCPFNDWKKPDGHWKQGASPVSETWPRGQTGLQSSSRRAPRRQVVEPSGHGWQNRLEYSVW